MKITHILLLAVIAVAIGVIISTTENASQYVDFEQASSMSDSGNDLKVHVVGTLPRDAQGEVTGIEYNPLKDPNFIAFRLIDEKQKEYKVVCFNPPASITDFKRSEKVVVNGNFKDNQFIADEILLKCPSKYENNKLEASAATVSY